MTKANNRFEREMFRFVCILTGCNLTKALADLIGDRRTSAIVEQRRADIDAQIVQVIRSQWRRDPESVRRWSRQSGRLMVMLGGVIILAGLAAGGLIVYLCLFLLSN